MSNNQPKDKTYYPTEWDGRFFFIDEEGKRASDNYNTLDELLIHAPLFKIPNERITDSCPPDLIAKITKYFFCGEVVRPVKLNSEQREYLNKPQISTNFI